MDWTRAKGGVEVGLIGSRSTRKELGYQVKLVGLGGEEGDGGVGGGERAGEGEDVAGGAAAAVEEDDGADGFVEGSAGAVEFAVGVGVGWAGMGSGGGRRDLWRVMGGEALLESGAAGFEPRGEAEAFAEGFGGLVDGEAGVVGG